MNTSHTKATLRTQRHKRLRSKVTGTADRPRLAVYRSNKFVYAQLIDDEAGKTLAAADSRKETKGTGVEKATAVGPENKFSNFLNLVPSKTSFVILFLVILNNIPCFLISDLSCSICLTVRP